MIVVTHRNFDQMDAAVRRKFEGIMVEAGGEPAGVKLSTVIHCEWLGFAEHVISVSDYVESCREELTEWLKSKVAERGLKGLPSPMTSTDERMLSLKQLREIDVDNVVVHGLVQAALFQRVLNSALWFGGRIGDGNARDEIRMALRLIEVRGIRMSKHPVALRNLVDAARKL